MNMLTTIATRRFSRTIAPVVALIAGALASCSDSGVDSETAQYIVGGEDKDTTTLNLEKAYIQAAILADARNVQVGDFVKFGRVTEYRVDTLPNGSVSALRGLHLKATFGDPNDPSVPNNFYPLHELRFSVPALEWERNMGPLVDLHGTPTGGAITGGLEAVFKDKNATVNLQTRANDSTNYGYANITGVDAAHRTISLYVKADLTNQIPRGNPDRIVNRLVVEIFLQLPY